VVARTKINFIKVLSIAQPIKQVINDMNGKFVFDGEFVQGAKDWARVPSASFLEYHDHRRGIWVGTRTDNISFEELLKNFLNFILLGKWMTIRENIQRKSTW
jgi:hypothetical protein